MYGCSKDTARQDGSTTKIQPDRTAARQKYSQTGQQHDKNTARQDGSKTKIQPDRTAARQKYSQTGRQQDKDTARQDGSTTKIQPDRTAARQRYSQTGRQHDKNTAQQLSVMIGTLLYVFWVQVNVIFQLNKRNVRPFKTGTKGSLSSSWTFL